MEAMARIDRDKKGYSPERVVAAATADTVIRSTPRNTGVTRPRSVATATEMSTAENCRTASGNQITFIAGTARWARAAAQSPRSARTGC